MPPILYTAPVLDQQGRISRPWAQWLQALQARVGGANAPTILELAQPLDLAVAGHTGTPSVQALAAGAGLGARATVTGRDQAGTLTLETQSYQARRSHSAVLTLTFAAAYTTTPRVTLTPANDAAWALPPGTVRLRQSDVTRASFTLRSGTARLPRQGATYIWTYVVVA